MSTASEVTIQALEYVVKTLPVGTNLALLHLLWALLSGAFLSSRGAVFPALQTLGLSAVQIRRSSQAVRDGAWSSDELVARWRDWVAAQGVWQPHSYAGYQPLAVDITAFWRPRLQGWLGKFFYRCGQSRRQGHRLRLGGASRSQRRATLALAQTVDLRRPRHCQRKPIQGQGAPDGRARAWRPPKCWCMMPAPRLPTCRPPRWPAMSCA